jgi:hypothetical protein
MSQVVLIPEFCDWLSQTHASAVVSTVTWIIPTTQIVHIVCVTIIIVPMLMLDLRMMGVLRTNQSIAAMADRFIPPIWFALTILFLTGVVLTIGEPGRELLSDAFRLKMVMVAAVAVITYLVQRRIKSDPTFWESRPGLAKVVALVSMSLWLSILTAGRMIAYLEHG